MNIEYLDLSGLYLRWDRGLVSGDHARDSGCFQRQMAADEIKSCSLFLILVDVKAISLRLV